MQMVGAEPSVKILYRRELEQAENTATLLEEKIGEYHEIYLNPYHSASRSVIDAVIHPKDTRKRIISALAVLENKAEPPRPWRKHGNMPV
jgi:acetyl-CoA/propionyl-CoA carboxylase